MAGNNYEFMIAWRFLTKGRAQTILIILGISVGVAVQFFLLSLIGGLQKSIIDSTVGAAPHITILPADSIPSPIGIEMDSIRISRPAYYIVRPEIFSWQQYINKFENNNEIKYISPVVNGNGFLQKGNTIVPVIIKGLAQPQGTAIYRVKEKLTAGKADISGETALIAKALAVKLNITTGDKFILRNDRGSEIFLILGGIFDLGAEAGDKLVLLSLNRARAFLGINGVSGIEAQVWDVFKAQSIIDQYGKDFTRVKLESWQEKNKELLTALSSQTSSSNTIQFFVLFSISLGIASVLGIAAVQKSRQLGILKAMGVTDRGSAKIFVIQGFILGTVGSILGLSIGLGISVLFIKAMGDAINFGLEINATYVTIPVVLAIIASTVAATIPARRASKLSPIEVIRNG